MPISDATKNLAGVLHKENVGFLTAILVGALFWCLTSAPTGQILGIE